MPVWACEAAAAPTHLFGNYGREFAFDAVLN